ncbi:alpha/beta hydrolase domain-containing protein [Streptomyces sp. B1I3]|uniref:alpha/beta hydrolase domain-containing protein n=1 Tax=Streptomyces sp. B1I3 TaxID=3042264 RepID=UPI0027D8F30D|nr:alpha/beta hydrolase domain-containing protein [Streptomyces sp. B1I3]
MSVSLAAVVLGTGATATALPAATAHSAAPRDRTAEPAVSGPVPGSLPGDPKANDTAGTYPWLSAPDLAGAGYVEEEFYLSGRADAYGPTGERLADDVPYTTRIVVRRPSSPARFNGTVLTEWQNVSGGYDLDALWAPDQITRAGYAWVGVSAQRVGVDQLRDWSPARYGRLDVTGRGRFTADEMSYDLYAQAAAALRAGTGKVLGPLRARTLLGIGASQSAGRMTVYYDRVLPQTGPVFDGYGFVVGSAPSRTGGEPVFHVLSETDVRTPVRRADDNGYRRWEVAGAAHSGRFGQAYREPLLARDLGAAPTFSCARPPFSEVPLHHVLAAAYAHLGRWVEHGVLPPAAPPLEFASDGTKARDASGLARGGVRLSQVEVPTALNTGDNTGETFCVLFGTHVPFTAEQLDRLYPTHAGYAAGVAAADARAVREGHLLPSDALVNLREAVSSDVGRD